MRPFVLALLTAVALGASACDAGDGATGGDGGSANDLAGAASGDLATMSTGDPEIDAWLAAHNTIRANAMPAPSPPLAPYTWSAAAAQVAATWAAGCTFAHNAGRGAYGENIYADTGRASGPADAVRSWASEAANYDYAANRCAAGKTCGHYTQIVWRTTTAIGCAKQTCTRNCPFGSCVGGQWNFFICDYSPPGNSGGRPY
jgi:hypothetical protein